MTENSQPEKNIPDAKAASSVVAGGLADLTEGGVLLPRFISHAADGLYVDLSLLESATNFQQFVDRVFTADAFFSGLDYPLFSKLLYPSDDTVLQEKMGQHELRLARDIIAFTPERRGIYHDVRISSNGSSAEYFFEPVSIDREIEEPVFGPPEADGSLPILCYEKRTQPMETRLDPDEFIAAMWTKGLRFGLDMEKVRAVIAKGGTERLEIARGRPCLAGRDAGIEEQTDALHRDNAPKILNNGRIDLARFNNHFPQVVEGTKLLKKSPRVLGTPGFSMQGSFIAPEMPKDFEIDRVAGTGTRIERTTEGEFVVAAITGFVNVDIASNAISVSEKIISRQGVSLRTTGDLALSGADFEEHGEVQERRQVKGHNMTFLADVFGDVISDGGDVLFKARLAGGSVRNPKGSIVIERSASGATIEGKGGEITIAAVEGCLVIGSKVRIKKAINCEILAEEVEVETSVACAVAGRRVKIGDAGSHRDIETVVTIFLPDSAILDKEIEALGNKIAAAGNARATHGGVAAQISDQPEVKKFLALQQKIKAKEIAVNAEQEIAWKAMQARFAAVTRQLDRLEAETLALLNQEQDLARQVTALEAEKAHAADESSCILVSVTGDTLVRTTKVASEGFPLGDLSAKEIRKQLRSHGNAQEKLFSGSSGSLNWSGNDLRASEPEDS